VTKPNESLEVGTVYIDTRADGFNPLEAIEKVHYHFTCFTTTGDRMNSAYHLLELGDAISNLITWHPGYSTDHGTMPWQREDAD
jgi:hypothetical protein